MRRKNYIVESLEKETRTTSTTYLSGLRPETAISTSPEHTHHIVWCRAQILNGKSIIAAYL